MTKQRLTRAAAARGYAAALCQGYPSGMQPGGASASWVAQLFSFISSHRRIRMALYNQGERVNGPFRLSRYPNSRHEIRRLIASPRFLSYAPEWGGH